MILSTLFAQVNNAFRGSDDDAPASGTDDYTLWLNTVNRKLSEWARDGKQARESLFEVRDIGTVAAGTQTYDLDDEILIPADKVVVTTTDDIEVEYVICKPQERDRFDNAVYISGSDPQKLTFADTIASTDNVVGGTISIAGYFIPDDLASDSDTIPVDDPYWLVYAVASELAFNDLTYEAKADSLNTKANNLYMQMNSNNRRGTNNNPRTVSTNVYHITGPERF